MAQRTVARLLQALLGLLALTASAGAAATDRAAHTDLSAGITLIQAEDVIRLARDHDDLIIIDSRTLADRQMGYIEDSIALPDDQTTCDALSKLSRKRDRPLLFYCNGVKCARSHRALQQASACGYSRLYWFKGGYEEWQAKRFPLLRPR